MLLGACGGGEGPREMPIEELDRAHQCYRCQEPCYRRYSVQRSPASTYFDCLKRCAEEHNVDDEICSVAHPETFRGYTKE